MKVFARYQVTPKSILNYSNSSVSVTYKSACKYTVKVAFETVHIDLGKVYAASLLTAHYSVVV